MVVFLLVFDVNFDVLVVLRYYCIGKCWRVVFGFSMCFIEFFGLGKVCVFLLWLVLGFCMIEYIYIGIELMLVFEGSFSYEGGCFGLGDFDYGDDEIDYCLIVGDEGFCVCLVVMSGDLCMNGFFGCLMGLFVWL